MYWYKRCHLRQNSSRRGIVWALFTSGGHWIAATAEAGDRYGPSDWPKASVSSAVDATEAGASLEGARDEAPADAALWTAGAADELDGKFLEQHRHKAAVGLRRHGLTQAQGPCCRWPGPLLQLEAPCMHFNSDSFPISYVRIPIDFDFEASIYDFPIRFPAGLHIHSGEALQNQPLFQLRFPVFLGGLSGSSSAP